MHTKPLFRKSQMTRGGYALLTALVVSALIILVATGMARRTVRQLQTHTIISDSFIAQNAAIAGIECAYFWDTEPAVIEDQALGVFYPNSGSRVIKCFDGIDITVNTDSNPVVVAANVGGEGCVEVAITKTPTGNTYTQVDDSSITHAIWETSIIADGYNSQLNNDGTECDKSSPFVVQRSVQIGPY